MQAIPTILKDKKISIRKDGKKQFVFLCRIGITITIFVFLFSRIDLYNWVAAVKRSLGFWLFLALLVDSLAIVTSTWKWDCLLRELGIYIRKLILLRLYTIGFFFSSFLPGIVSGDIVRCWMLGRRAGGHLKVAATILVERTIGVVVLVLICVVEVVWHSDRLGTAPTLLLLATISSTVLGGLGFVLNRRLVSGLMFRARHYKFRQVVKPLHRLHHILRTFSHRPIIAAGVYSVIFYLIGGFTFFLICKASGARVTFFEAIAAQMFTYLLTLIPISVGGLGITQAGHVYFLGLFGVDAATALGISILRKLIHLGYASIGGLLFIKLRNGESIVDVPELTLDQSSQQIASRVANSKRSRVLLKSAPTKGQC